jgi:hypothetical protein
MIGLGLIMRSAAICALVVVTGCAYNSRPFEGDDLPPVDVDGRVDSTPPDARIDAAPTDPCLAWINSWNGNLPAEFDPCGIPPPTTGHIAINAGAWTLDDEGVLRNGGTTIDLAHITIDDVAIISVERLEVLDPATLRLVGDDPIAIAVWTDATITGTIDASSDFNDPGPGADPQACPTGLDPGDPDVGGNQNGGDGGSGGGGFQGDGGDGANGNSNSGNGNGGSGGDGRQLPEKIEGGCSGAPAQSGASGYAGVGGGAVMIAVLDVLVINGTITAGGGGGGGATGGGSEAGGGGGSGGMIKLEARSLTVNGSARLTANGGQGGGGNQGDDADPGEDAQEDGSRAFIQNREGNGGDGGGGGYGTELDGENATPDPAAEGGGGGGGGVGYIIYRGYQLQSVNGAATISPPAQVF